jgi:hypothetical protein
MRKAFVGMSGPTFFDFENSASRTLHDRASSPNPILDSPSALILLYDEIWFLCRSLCPESMRKLPFVHFLLEDKLIIERFTDFTFHDDASDELIAELNDYADRKDFFGTYDNNLFSLGVSWWRTKGAAIDNHSHGLDLSSLGIDHGVASNPTDVRCLLLDHAVMNHLGGDFELVTNAFMQQVLAPVSMEGEISQSLLNDTPLVDAIVLKGLPNRLTRSGPDVNFLGELRENGCLPHFRKWVTGYDKRVSVAELREIEDEVTAAIEKHKDSYFKKFDPKEYSKSISKTVLTEGIGLIVPGFTKAMKFAKGHSEYRELSSGRWSAFIGMARRLAERQ